jgi:hypothetical protein
VNHFHPKERKGPDFTMAEVDDFEREVALVRENEGLMAFLKERSHPGPTMALDQVKNALGLRESPGPLAP